MPGGGRTSGLQGEACAVVARAPGGTRRACGVRAAGPAAGLPVSGPPAPRPGRGARLSVRPFALRGGRRSASGEARGNAVLTARTAPCGSALSSREPCPSWGSVCVTVSVTRTRPCAAGSSALQTAPSVLRSVCHGPTRRQPRSDVTPSAGRRVTADTFAPPVGAGSPCGARFRPRPPLRSSPRFGCEPPLRLRPHRSVASRDGALLPARGRDPQCVP